MGVLARKIHRELWSMRGQALAIALVIASGIALYIMSLMTLESLSNTREVYYRDYRFAEVFASLKRAPKGLLERVREIPGVALVEARVRADVRLEVEDYDDPVRGTLISLPDYRAPTLNRLFIRAGRLPAAGSRDEVVISESFAESHGLVPGNHLHAVINGRRERLTIVGLVLSPEYVYEIGPGSTFPDFERYGVLWMGEQALATAYNMEGGFNDLSLTLARGGSTEEVIDRLDDLLELYGGLGAYSRDTQVSHQYLDQEFAGLEAMGAIFPVIFLGVAAFLLNVVMSRLIALERDQIGVLKAFGYANLPIAWHYLRFVLTILAVGAVIGLGAGIWLGRALSALYTDFYRFPFLEATVSPAVLLTAVAIGIVAAVLGTLQAVSKAVRLPPAEAMSPEPPPIYRETILERAGVKRWLSQPARMILRHLTRRPIKAAMSILGISMAVAIMMVGSFQSDAIDYMVNVQFGLAQRDDLVVIFNEPVERRALFEMRDLPGVVNIEPFRGVPVRLRAGHREYRTAIQGVEPDGDIYRLLDTDLQVVDLPESGLLITEYIANRLRLAPGDRVAYEMLEGRRTRGEAVVEAVVSQYIGAAVYLRMDALSELLRESPAVTGAFFTVDEAQLPELLRRLNESPRVTGLMQSTVAIDNFYETMAETILVFTFINTMLASTIAFGVVYNSARISLSERSRELASLRVLGFSRGEISYILLGELALLTLLALPVGFGIGYAICAYIAANLASELYQVPLILEPSTHAFAASAVLVSAVISGLVIWQRLGSLDLVGVLKTRE